MPIPLIYLGYAAGTALFAAAGTAYLQSPSIANPRKTNAQVMGDGLAAGAEAVGDGIQATGEAISGVFSSSAENADEEAEKRLSEGSAVEACSTCPPPEDPDDEPTEQDAKDAKRMKTRQLEQAARNNGYRDAHHMKRELGLNSRYDIFADRQGRMYAGPRQGTGTPQYLHMNVRGF